MEASQSQDSGREPGGLRQSLESLRARARRVLMLRAVAMTAACIAAGLVAAVLIDFALRLPVGARWVVLVAGLAGIAWMTRAWLLRAFRFAPSLTSVALRVEASQPGRGVSGSLASALELSDDHDGDETTGLLRSRAIAQATQSLRGVDAGALIRTEPARRGVAALGAAALLAIALAVAFPSLASIGLARTLTPWSDAQWPKRTEVVTATSDAVHAAGEPIVLRALLTRSHRGMGQTDVDVRFRIVRADDTAEPWRTLALSAQRREGRAGDDVGEVYERLTDTPVLERDATLEFRFVTVDDQTPVHRVTLAPRPKLIKAVASVTPPEYAARAGVTGVLSGEAINLDTGSRVIGAADPVLAGSSVALALTFNKPLPAWDDAEVVAAEQLGDASLAGALSASESGETWILRLQPSAQIALSLMPQDEHGLTPTSASTLRLDVIQDEPPAVAIVDPARDESVIASAVVPLVGDARDDIGLRKVELVAQLARSSGSSPGDSAEPTGEEMVITTTEVSGTLSAQATAGLALTTLGAQPGDEVWLWALASDVLEAGGAPREPTRSAKRTLRIIDLSELEAQIRGELSAIRRSAMRLEEQQREASEQLAAEPQDPRAGARQESITRRLEAQQGALDKLAERLDRNQMGDGPLAGLLQDAGAIAAEATESSQQAERDLASREAEQDEAVERATQQQQQVREALSDLIAALDRGEDAWVARRGVEQLLEEQRRIAADTASLGERTAGRSLDQLSPAERSELERILERQQRAADAGREAIEELDRRADQLAGRDPAQASALRDAASQGRSSQLEQRQSDAADNLSQNQTSDAGANQQQAIEALEQMLDQIDQAEQKRDEVLRRILASLIESIDSLIAQQKTQLDLLAAANDQNVEPLADGMIRLDANTLAVIALAREAPGEVDTLVQLLSGAEEAQQDAIGALRRGESKLALKRETVSLDLLQKAKAEAERLEEEAQQREADRRLDDLKAAYTELLERQVMLQTEVDPFAGREITRRERAQVRGLGEQQRTIGEDLTEVREANGDLEQTLVFTLALDRIDAASASAADALRAGTADAGVQRDQSTVARLLRSILEALEDDQPEQDEFADGSQQGGGGGASGGEQPLVPPIAELKLLRAMQIEAAEWTRAIDEQGGDSAQIARLGALQRDLADRGQQLIESMQQPGPGGGG